MARVKNFLKVALVSATVAAGVGLTWWQLRKAEVQPAEFHQRGKFGPVVSWPLIPIQVATLPDGRMLSFGSDAKGRQGAQGIYDVWDPRKGVGPESHLTLPNITSSDIFCSGQLIVPADESVMILGGDRTVDGVRNWSNADINSFNYKDNRLTKSSLTMARPRWYPTVMTLSNGDVLVLGGRLDPGHYSPIPELYTPGVGWRTLPGAEKDFLFGESNWNYPRAWQMPSGKILLLHRLGYTHVMDVNGAGSIKALPHKLVRGHSYLPSLMYAPGKILSIRIGGIAYKIDVNGEEPTVQSAAWAGLARFNSMATVMADGQVFLNGGGVKNNDSGSELLADRVSQIWNPDKDVWTAGAVASKSRLYHSTALLQQDATVFTGGGGAGAQSAINQLNAEIYYPPYLFKKDGSGQFADRPAITQAPSFITWLQPFDVMAKGDISRVTLVKMGSATHAQVYDQRFATIPFTQGGGGRITVTVDKGAKDLPPGYYFLFVFNADGVPSVAKILQLAK